MSNLTIIFLGANEMKILKTSKQLEREFYEGACELSSDWQCEFYNFKLQIKCASVPKWLDYCTICNLVDAKLAKEKTLDGTDRFRIVDCGTEDIVNVK